MQTAIISAENAVSFVWCVRAVCGRLSLLAVEAFLQRSSLSKSRPKTATRTQKMVCTYLGPPERAPASADCTSITTMETDSLLTPHCDSRSLPRLYSFTCCSAPADLFRGRAGQTATLHARVVPHSWGLGDHSRRGSCRAAVLGPLCRKSPVRELS